jgi:hypothetical protein
MESFQGHLSCGLTNGLGGNSSTSITRRHASPLIGGLDQSDEFIKHAFGHLFEVLLGFFLLFAELLVNVVDSGCDVFEESNITIFKLLTDAELALVSEEVELVFSVGDFFNNALFSHLDDLLASQAFLFFISFSTLSDDGVESAERNRKLFVIHKHGIEAIFTIGKLDNLLSRSSDCTIVLNNQFFHGFHQPSMHVTRSSSLNSGIDETFTTTDCMEEELCGRQAIVEGILDETFSCWFTTVRPEVR